MKKFWADFKKFITRGNVVDMAVGVAVASAFTAIVNALTKGFISPLIALLTNSSDLSELKWVVREAVYTMVDGEEVLETAEVAILWGSFVQAIINFLIIALTLFIVMRVVASISARSKKMHDKMVSLTKSSEEKAKEEAEAKAKEEEEAKAKAEAEAEAARIEAEKIEDRNRLIREEALLAEIRDLLRNK